ncbi:zinc finger protein 277 isoform X2 [Periplaneta americana]|uniref:zinc finger protein 277 isoform X2 n=1 Tax=Periplaneta americana TaxID=6978 RepID=UPI0037E98FE4
MDIEINGEDGAFGPLTFPSKDSSSTNEHDFNAEEDVICIFCSRKYVLPYQKALFNNHLFTWHQFIISDMQLIASVKMYCEYWRIRFASVPPEEICLQKMSDAKLDGSKVWALAQQAKEREDKNFTRGCLLCRLQFHGCRADYLNHLSLLHNMQLGRPENLVFVDDLLNAIERKLENLRCLFCSKIFKDRTVLKEHMRKKQHKKINPDHVEFDKYYIINYLEMGKDWQQVQNEPDDEMFTVECSDGYLSDWDWSDWYEDEETVENPVVCLFCEASSTFEKTLKHLKDFHNFDFTTICSEAGLDFYQQVKLVNYIRRQIHLGHCPYCNESCPSKPVLLGHMANYSHFTLPGKQLWDQPEYFFPTYENDSFLCHLDDHQDDMNEIQLSNQMMKNCNVGQS